jgi:hypothetical protein
MFAVILFVFELSKFSSHQIQEVDLIEYNHYYDDTGKKILDQIIAYDWDESTKQFVVRQWWIPTELQVSRHGNYKLLQWTDRIKYIHRKLRTKSFKETHTDYDPEVRNRKYLDQQDRIPVFP